MVVEKAKTIVYKITVREPSWETAAMMWDTFDSVSGAEEFIRGISSTYPEGTLLFITGVWVKGTRWNPSGRFVRKAFMVDEYGGVVSRKRKWVPEGKMPVEWIKDKSILNKPKPLTPKEFYGMKIGEGEVNREGLSSGEERNLDRMLEEIIPEYGDYEAYERKYPGILKDRKDFPNKPWYGPDELEELFPGREII